MPQLPPPSSSHLLALPMCWHQPNILDQYWCRNWPKNVSQIPSQRACLRIRPENGEHVPNQHAPRVKQSEIGRIHVKTAGKQAQAAKGGIQKAINTMPSFVP